MLSFVRYLFFSVLLFSLQINSSFASQQSYGSVVIDEVTSIYDGDTFRVNINSWPGIIGHRIPVRIAGIDTPELRGKCQKEKEFARKAKQFTVSMLRSANMIELKNMRRGKYFRIVADVFLDGESLGENLIKSNLAVRYDGGIKLDWCSR